MGCHALRMHALQVQQKTGFAAGLFSEAELDAQSITVRFEPVWLTTLGCCNKPA